SLGHHPEVYDAVRARARDAVAAGSGGRVVRAGPNFRRPFMLEPGTRLGPYEIVSALGAGGMGEVYRARDERVGRAVAVKLLSGRLSGAPAALSRFEREARAVAALSHPNILSIFDVGREGSSAYLVMELLDGDSLREKLRDGALPTRRAVDVAV